MNEVILRSRLHDGTLEEARVVIADREPWWIEVSSPGSGHHKRFEDDDLFQCLVAFRQVQEARMATVLCAGARLDVFPSRMSRQMSGGRKAYVLILGRPAVPDNLVDIFQSASDHEVGTVGAQRDRFQQWMRSLP